ncbi:hypothetical protein D3C84_794370 [compost metagenome]
MADISGIANQLQQDTGNLLIIDQDVVRPLQAGISHTERLQRTHNRKPHHQAQALKLTHAAFNTQHQAVIEVLGKRTDPLTPTPPASCRLALGQHQKGSSLTFSDCA